MNQHVPYAKKTSRPGHPPLSFGRNQLLFTIRWGKLFLLPLRHLRSNQFLGFLTSPTLIFLCYQQIDRFQRMRHVRGHMAVDSEQLTKLVMAAAGSILANLCPRSMSGHNCPIALGAAVCANQLAIAWSSWQPVAGLDIPLYNAQVPILTRIQWAETINRYIHQVQGHTHQMANCYS